jgi:hypothetical protein
MFSLMQKENTITTIPILVYLPDTGLPALLPSGPQRKYCNSAAHQSAIQTTMGGITATPKT